MMKRLALFALLVIALALPNAAHSQNIIVTNCGTVPASVITLTAGNQGPGFIDTTGKLCTAGGGGAATIADGADVAQGTTTDSACATDNGTCTEIALTKRTNQRLTTINTTLGTPMQATGGTVGLVPSSASGAALTTVTTASAVEANHVIKASPGNLYGFQVSADATLSGAAWWVMIYNATSAPVDGAVTPIKCYALPSGTTLASASWPMPIAFSTGITIGVSTTGCFSKTASAHAFISGDAQ